MIVYTLILCILLNLIFADAGVAADYDEIQCQVLGYRIITTSHLRSCGKNCYYREYENMPLLFVNLIFNNTNIQYYTNNNYEARKAMSIDDSDFPGYSDAVNYAQSFTVNNTYRCWYKDDSDVLMTQPNDDNIILTAFLAGGLGLIFCCLICCPCITILFIFFCWPAILCFIIMVVIHCIIPLSPIIIIAIIIYIVYVKIHDN